MLDKSICLATISLIALSLAGCGSSSNGGNSDKDSVDQSPATVTVGFLPGWLTEEERKQYIIDPVQKKYPWITVEMKPYEKGSSLAELVVAGDIPDIVIDTNIHGFNTWSDLGLMYPLSDLIKSNKMDLNRFEPEALDAIKAATQRDDLVAIPYTRHFSALYYNKNVFDKFAVPYPKDGMTWEEAYELAKRLTRQDNGVQYRGLEVNVIERMASQLSLPYVDPKTKQALINTEKWRAVLDFAAKVYQIPGNNQIATYGKAAEQMLGGTLAMYASLNDIMGYKLYSNPDVWDIATYPSWPEAPGLGTRVDAHAMGITSTSKHKQAAFKVIETITSDEVQMMMSRRGKYPVLKDPKFGSSFGADMGFMNNKNIEAIYKTKPAKTFIPTEYDNIAMKAMNGALSDIVKKGVDANSALRQAEESINKQIGELEAGSK
ncbi:ABC transporter substrate-binding protein [Paenibacillus sp. GYB003]|uniref:ABC transporter substrate-binding protein n=1 Tax=Paenibacillus sp. GYB003 TaxID=2994392 RepID=UPI002F9669E3